MEKYLVGIFSVPKYQSEDIVDLPFCVNDSIGLKDVFNNHLGIEDENIKILGNDLNQEVSKADILKNLVQLRRKAEPDDTMIFYFSGHGFTENNVGYIATYDTDLAIASDTSIPISRIRDELNKSEARIKILIIDSCYSGIGTGKKFNSLMSEEFENSLFSEISEGWVIFASCKRDEMSYFLEDNSMSVFTSYLIEGFKGNADTDKDSIISLDDLNIYVTKMVSKWGIENDKYQTPNINVQLAGRLIFPIKNPESTEDFSIESEYSSIEMTTQNIVLTSNYTSPFYREIIEFQDGPYPTGEYEEVPYEVRKYVLNDYKKKSVGKLFATIIKYFKPSQITCLNDDEYDLPFGKFITKSISPTEIEEKLTISKDLFTSPITDILNSIDDQRDIKWNSIEYIFNGNFDLDIVQDIAKKKGYNILEFYPYNKFLVISQEDESVSNKIKWKLSFENDSQLAKLKIFEDTILGFKFFQTIPISELIDLFSTSLKNT